MFKSEWEAPGGRSCRFIWDDIGNTSNVILPIRAQEVIEYNFKVSPSHDGYDCYHQVVEHVEVDYLGKILKGSFVLEEHQVDYDDCSNVFSQIGL